LQKFLKYIILEFPPPLIIFAVHSAFLTLSFYPPHSQWCQSQKGPVLSSCSVFEKQKGIFVCLR
jgi:hypothetical protein